MKYLRIKVGMFVRKLGRKIQPDYWKCFHCGIMTFKEEEVICWGCGIGDMIYKGD